jgi:hypothetical protein
MIERMSNDFSERPRPASGLGWLFDRRWGSAIEGGDAMFWAPITWVLLLIWTSVAGGPREWLPFLPLTWFAQSLFSAPFIVWTGKYFDGLASSRLIGALAAGAAPGLFFIPINRLDEPPLVWAALPALIAWSVMANYFAFHRLPKSRPWRTTLLAAGALACLGAAAWAAVLAVTYRPSFHDTAFEQALAWGLSGLCLAAVLFFGWQGFRLAKGLLAP